MQHRFNTAKVNISRVICYTLSTYPDLNSVTLYQRIYEVVCRIPAGNVASYGRIARMVKTGPRQVGYAMAALTSDQDVPWHRVINSKGELSLRKDGKADDRQRQLLTEEGVIFDRKGRVSFDQYGWLEAEFDMELEDSYFLSEKN